MMTILAAALLLPFQAPVPPPPVVQAPVPAAPAVPVAPAPPPAFVEYTPPPAGPAQPAPPPAPALSHLRVLVAACDASGLQGPSLADVVTMSLLRTGRVALGPAGAVPAARDATTLAVLGATTGSEKVVCTTLQASGSQAVVATQFVDARTAEVEFTRVEARADATPETLRTLAAEQGDALAAFILAGFEQPVAAGPPPPSAPPVPPATSTAEKSRPAFMNPLLGAGVALMGVGASLLPLAGLGVVLAGVGHMGGQALMLVPPGGDPPRYYSALFTTTWGDLVLAGGTAGAGMLLMVAGAALVGAAFLVPWLFG